ncbi:MAG TPA: AraC family transcriptional regulator [Polyangiaceae bacterium]
MGSGQATLVQFPPGARHGLPIAVTKVNGYDKPVHAKGPHSHGFFSIMYVTEGSGTLTFGRRRVDVGPGSITLTAPGEVHDTTELKDVTRWALDFTPDAFGAEGAGWLFPRPSRPEWLVLLRRSWDEAQALEVPDDDRALWERRLTSIEREVNERQRGYREAVRAELKLLLIRASRLVANRETPEAISPLLGEVFDAIESNFSDPLSLSDVAKMVGRSPAHLTTVVRNQTGMTVQQWIIERRMAEARQRLLMSDENVIVLAERVGYNDPTLFIRHFKRAHGVTPRAWRRSLEPSESATET